MKIILKLLLLSLIAITHSGCLSVPISAYGKSYDHLTTHSITMDEVEKDLGTPVWSKSFVQPVKIKDTIHYKNYDESSKGCSVWGVNNTPEEEFISYCAVYQRKGPFQDMRRAEPFAMVSGITFGVGELYCLPVSIITRYDLSSRYFTITFWFDQNKRYVGFLKGDIRDPGISFTTGEKSKQ